MGISESLLHLKITFISCNLTWIFELHCAGWWMCTVIELLDTLCFRFITLTLVQGGENFTKSLCFFFFSISFHKPTIFHQPSSLSTADICSLNHSCYLPIQCEPAALVPESTKWRAKYASVNRRESPNSDLQPGPRCWSFTIRTDRVESQQQIVFQACSSPSSGNHRDDGWPLASPQRLAVAKNKSRRAAVILKQYLTETIQLPQGN